MEKIYKCSEFFPAHLQRGLEELRTIFGGYNVGTPIIDCSSVYPDPNPNVSKQYGIFDHKFSPGYMLAAGIGIDNERNITVPGLQNSFYSGKNAASAFQKDFSRTINAVIMRLIKKGEQMPDKKAQALLASAVKNLRKGLQEFTVEHIDEKMKAAQSGIKREEIKLRQQAHKTKSHFQAMLKEKPGKRNER